MKNFFKPILIFTIAVCSAMPVHAYKIILLGNDRREYKSEGAEGVLQPGGRIVSGEREGTVVPATRDIRRAPTTQAPPVAVPSEYAVETMNFNGDYSGTFHDVQSVQIEAAQANGINPLDNSSDIGALVADGILMPVTSNDLYNCTAEYPYLVPKALSMVNEVATRYHAYAGTGRPMKLSSCMRTHESVARLMRVNGNAVRHSCHLYGTTFDISYSGMTPAEKAALGRALVELQQGGYIYVMYEVRQPCFHITVR